MNKIQRFVFSLLVTVISLPIFLQRETNSVCLPEVEEITAISIGFTPFSIPQDSNSPSQPIEEDLGDDDDQDKKLEHAAHFYVDPNSFTLSQFHLAFKEQHHEVVTPPPQF